MDGWMDGWVDGRATVNHLCTVSHVFRLTSVGLRSCVKSHSVSQSSTNTGWAVSSQLIGPLGSALWLTELLTMGSWLLQPEMATAKSIVSSR